MGGVEQITYDYVSRISANNKDIEFSFVNQYGKIIYQDEYEKMGCRIYNLPDVNKNPAGYAAKLFKIIQSERIDAVHCNMLSAANVVPLLAARLAGCGRVIAHSHNTGTVGLHKYMLHYICRPLVPLLATDLFTCSEKAGRFMFGRGKGENAALVRNAVNVKTFSFDREARKKIRRELEIEDGDPLFGHAGRFAEAKNHSFIIDIFRSLSRKRETAKLLLVGEGHLEQAVRRQTEKYRLAGKVIFYGASPRIHELYSAMDAFLLPSLFEGLSVVGAEAQCNGLCVAASDSISKEMDILGQVKWRSLSDPPDAWADTALECLAARKTEDTSAMMAQAGYDIDAEAGKLERIYAGLTAR
jgi:glycosyltransferase involved in cell wall biosynthesis